MADNVKYHLVVTRPFHNPATKKLANIGDVITESGAVTTILGSHHATFVVKVPETEWPGDEPKEPTPVQENWKASSASAPAPDKTVKA